MKKHRTLLRAFARLLGRRPTHPSQAPNATVTQSDDERKSLGGIDFRVPLGILTCASAISIGVVSGLGIVGYTDVGFGADRCRSPSWSPAPFGGGCDLFGGGSVPGGGKSILARLFSCARSEPGRLVDTHARAGPRRCRWLGRIRPPAIAVVREPGTTAGAGHPRGGGRASGRPTAISLVWSTQHAVDQSVRSTSCLWTGSGNLRHSPSLLC